MNPELEFARKTALAYNALCRPLCQELNLPQTAFDILMFLLSSVEDISFSVLSLIAFLRIWTNRHETLFLPP